MASFITLSKSVHEVAIAAKVVDPRTSIGVAGASVEITSMPAAFTSWLSLRALGYGSKWATMTERPDRTVTADDGMFCFLDLPDGAYTVAITPKGGGRRFGATTHAFTVARDASGDINATIALISLPATAIEGTIVESQGDGSTSSSPISMATIQMQGTLERTYTDASGAFYLTDIEPGVRKLTISATGYQTVTVTATIVKGEITEMGSFVMSSLSSTD
jgi:hypothetical protein